jgi:hypothetical protein
MSGDSSARAAPVPPVSVPKINISRTTEPSQRSARGAGIPTMTLPPAKLDLGAQLEAALAEDDDIRPRADDSNQMCRQEIAIPPREADGLATRALDGRDDGFVGLEQGHFDGLHGDIVGDS